MIVQVLFFAATRDQVGLESDRFELPEAELSIATLERYICGRFPSLLGHLGGVRFAINEEFAQAETLVRSGDTVALIPPTAGG
ncbi:MAG: hypothetical protein RJA70_651 [Pseudomonadota bacterium]|jgi:molybdopterin converting factor subunit 1